MSTSCRWWPVRYVLLVVAVLAAAAPCAAQPECAPRFLSNRRGRADGPNPPSRWSSTENVRWKTDLPGLAWSSPIVWENRVFVTTCASSGEVRGPRKGLYIEDLDANKYPPDTVPRQWKVLCLDLATGQVLWERLAHEGVSPKPHHIKNTLASETPATDGQRVVAHFGNIGMFCYDLDGRPLWSLPVEPAETRMGWGTSSSPVLHEGRVYLLNDNEQHSYLAAIDAATGKELWRVDREEKTNFSTPFVWVHALRTEIVISGIEWAKSYDLDGQLLWRLKGVSVLAIPTPFAEFGNLYVTSGHVAWGENPLYAIRPGASGDITPQEGKTASEYLAWRQKKGGPYHPTPLIVGDQIYVLLDRGMMTSFDAKTGEEVYPRTRIPNGRAFTSSPWSYDDKIFCLNEDGVTFVIRSGPKFEVLDTNALAEDDMCMATPVVLGDKLLVRTSARLYCIAPQRQAAAKPSTAAQPVAQQPATQ